MTSIPMIAGMAICLTGCASQQSSQDYSAMSTPVHVVNFVCANDEHVEMRFFPIQGVAVMIRGGTSMELQQEPAGSGFLYRGESVSVRGKGDEIMIDDGRTAPLRCEAKT